MRILLLGPPASGKGTIGRLLSDYFNIPVISVGKFLRGITPDSSHYELVQEVMAKGELVPNDLLGKILSDKVKDSRYENGYIVEGWGRQLSDLKYFDPDPHVVILLDVTKKTSWERTSNRRVCKAQGHTYNYLYNPPKKEGKCDIDGSELIIRTDDNKETFERRWEVHQQNTTKTIDYYRKKGKLVEISAESSPAQIFADIKQKLGAK